VATAHSMSDRRTGRKSWWLYFVVALAILPVPYSVVLHSITKPDQGQIIVTKGRGSSGDNFVYLETEYTWHYFQRGIVYGDVMITPFREMMRRNFDMPFERFRYFDPSNPTPVMLTVFFSILALVIRLRDKNRAHEKRENLD